MITNIIGTIFPRHSLLSLCKSAFSVQNYMKTFQSNCVSRHHGYFRVDEYHHFDSNAESLQEFVDSQRRLFQKESAKWKSLTQQYYQISSSRCDARTASIPEIYDNYEYYTRVSWHQGREYSVIYRCPIGNPAKQELVLDIMHYPLIRRSFKTVELLKTSFSPSHRYVAFGVDLKNNQKTSFLLADTHSTKKELVQIQEGTYRIEDVNDMIFGNETEVFYLKIDNHRPCRLVFQDLVSGKTEDMYEQTDAQYYLHIRLSKDKRYLILTGSSKQRSKIWIVDLASRQRKLIKVWEESSKVYLNHVDDHFIVWLQGDSSVVKLIGDQEFLEAVKRQGNKELNFKNLAGTVLYRCQQEQVVEEIDIVREHIVLYMQRINFPLLKVINYSKDTNKQSGKDSPYKIQVTDAPLPYNFGVISPGTNENITADEIVFFMSTPFVFDEVYSYSIRKKTCSTIQRYQHTGPKFPVNKYQISHVDVPSTTMDYIPLTIIGPKKRAPGKLLIHFYGFYGIPTRVGYDNVSIAALQKGWTIAYAHVRGGGEKGKRWHQQALGMNRDRTWKDLEECVGYLIKQGYTHPSLLFISSHSAGAIALWNAINHKPNLYKGAIFKFPFLDVLTSLLDKSQPLSNTDYEQFGNPIENKNSYQEIEAISPYQNIQCIEYPVIHIVAGENDYRTPVNQVAKFVSRFRDRALENGRVQPIGIKGTTVDISSSASHLGEASIKDENYKGCDVFGYMDYVLNKASKDCKFMD